jgi:hypothetical protein
MDMGTIYRRLFGSPTSTIEILVYFCFILLLKVWVTFLVFAVIGSLSTVEKVEEQPSQIEWSSVYGGQQR